MPMTRGTLLNQGEVRRAAAAAGFTQVSPAALTTLDRHLREDLQARMLESRGKAKTSRKRLTRALVCRMTGRPDQLELKL